MKRKEVAVKTTVLGIYNLRDSFWLMRFAYKFAYTLIYGKSIVWCPFISSLCISLLFFFSSFARFHFGIGIGDLYLIHLFDISFFSFVCCTNIQFAEITGMPIGLSLYLAGLLLPLSTSSPSRPFRVVAIFAIVYRLKLSSVLFSKSIL